MESDLEKLHLSFIGCGVMAESIIAGLLRKKLVKPEQISASHPREARRAELTVNYGIRVFAGNAEAAQGGKDRENSAVELRIEAHRHTALEGERMAANIDTAPSAADRVLVLTRTLDAPRELVFRVWTKPEHLTQWLGPNDFTIPFCEVDFRVGGAYRFCMRSPAGEDHWAWGVYREIIEPERIVFTWNRDDIDGRPRRDSLVTVTFADSGGKTHLMLRHSDFGTKWDRDDHAVGWTQCMDRLAAFVAKTLDEAI